MSADSSGHRSTASILLLRPGAIGDTLLTVPALRILRRTNPEAAIHLVGNAVAAPLLLGQRDVDGRPLVDRWTTFDDAAVTGLFVAGGPTTAARRTFGHVGLAVAWCSDPEGVVRASLAGLGAEGVVVAPSRPDPTRGIHVADHLVETLPSLETPIAASGLDGATPLLAVPPEWIGEVVGHPRFGALLARQFVLIHPGSGSPTKNWPLERFAEVARALPSDLGASPVVVLGPAEEDRASEARTAFGPSVAVLGDVPLTALAALVWRAHAYLGNDSGLTHLAGMLGVPTLALFGPTDPRMWAPLGPHVTVLRREPLSSLEVGAVLHALTSA